MCSWNIEVGIALPKVLPWLSFCKLRGLLEKMVGMTSESRTHFKLPVIIKILGSCLWHLCGSESSLSGPHTPESSRQTHCANVDYYIPGKGHKWQGLRRFHSLSSFRHYRTSPRYILRVNQNIEGISTNDINAS
jgi:hypothetical protein